jgi:hypothetical protein
MGHVNHLEKEDGMEASVVVEAPPVEGVEEQIAESHPTEPAAQNANVIKMFRYSEYMHVGPGAVECEHATDGECEDHEHFHAWCRLPNKFQHRDLYTKAMAAKARRLRLLADEGSDAREVLESELDGLRADIHLETIIDDLLKAEWAQDYISALSEVTEREEYEHIEQDRERFKTLGETEDLDDEEAQSEEFRELMKHIGDWTAAVETEMESLQEPKREALRVMDSDQLIDQLRKGRIAQIGDEVYLHVYNQWEWFICTLKVKLHPQLGKPYERYWEEMGTLEDPKPGSMWGESPEVIDALQETYNQLERALGAGVSGNS